MRIRTRLLFYLLIIALTMTTCSATQNTTTVLQATPTKVYLPVIADSPSFPTRFGVAGNGSYDKVKAAGVSWLRVTNQMMWAEIEATEGVYDWSKAAPIENQLREAAKNGLQVILQVQGTPTWARIYPSSSCGPIREDKFASFGNFLYQVVQRYSQPPYNVEYYQIWNEPDMGKNDTGIVYGCWGDPESKDDTFGGQFYGKMLAQVYPRIKAANPDAQVISGALMMLCDPRDPDPDPTLYCADPFIRKMGNFFKGVLATGKNSFDLVMFNAGPSYKAGQNSVYSELNNWRWENERGGMVNGKISYLREAMASVGVDKPIIQAEAYFLDRPDITLGYEPFETFEEQKADYLVWVYANGWAQDLESVIWYSVEGWKGSELLINGTEETKAFQALESMTGLLQKAQLVSRIDYPGGFTRFVFRTIKDDIWLMVPTGQVYGANYTIAKPANSKRVLNIYGVEQTVTGATITFNRPTYIILSGRTSGLQTCGVADDEPGICAVERPLRIRNAF